MSKDTILNNLTKNRKRLKSFGVRKIGIFGSFAVGTQKRGSDIDFLVDFENKTFDNYMDLKFFLERQFNRKVDLVISSSIKPQLKPIILKQVKYAKGL